jgi:hypothetical protein
MGCCLHFFYHRISPANRARSFQILGSSVVISRFVTGSKHPLRLLSAKLLKTHELPPSIVQFLEPYSGSISTLRRRSLAATAEGTCEDLFQSLPGKVILQLVPAQPTQLPLTYDGRSVITLSWVAPWAAGILKMPSNHIPVYFELDASFRALKPYVYIVPTIVVANYGVPLGIVVTPTERAISYRMFWQTSEEWDIQSDVYARPLLSDKGGALIAYGQDHSRHWFCFRHLLESLGSRTYVAILAHRLVFCASQMDYERNHAEAAIALAIALSLNRVTRSGAERFCQTFGFTLLSDGSCRANAIDPFEAEALWGERGQAGVSACTNHVEGLHARLNAATSDVRLISRRLKRMVDVIWQKAERFSADAHRSAKRKFTQMLAEAKRHDYDSSECECGWSSVYSRRFGIDNFPCVHTCQQNPVDFHAQNQPNPEFNFDRTIGLPLCRDYDGSDWDFVRIQGEEGASANRDKSMALGSEDLDDVPDADVDAFVRRLIREVSGLNPRRGSGLKVGNVSAAFGAFCAHERETVHPDFHDIALKVRFELDFFGSDLR